MKLPRMLKQRLLGLAMIAISIAIIAITTSGNPVTPADGDAASAVLITLPMGIYGICAKKVVFLFD